MIDPKKEVRIFLPASLARRIRVEAARREDSSPSEVVADLVKEHLPEVAEPRAALAGR